MNSSNNWPGPVSLTELYEIISTNLFLENISDANERLDCARRIAYLLESRNGSMAASSAWNYDMQALPRRETVDLAFQYETGETIVVEGFRREVRDLREVAISLLRGQRDDEDPGVYYAWRPRGAPKPKNPA